MELQFINYEEWGIDITEFNSLTNKFNDYVEVFDGTLNVIFVNDSYIHALNKNYRDKDQSTDVLSFTYKDLDSDFGDVVGEVYISIDTAKKQASEYKHSISDELRKLIVHGVLHIHGFDHEVDKDYEAMKKVEEDILKGVE